jgi:hypothetical protein
MTEQRIDAAAAMLATQSCMHNGELPPEAVREWFVRACNAWLNGVPLEQAFQLRPAAASFAIRDNWLRIAACHCDNDARSLAQEISRHPRRRASKDSPLHTALDAAQAAGRRLPASAKHLRRILKAA